MQYTMQYNVYTGFENFFIVTETRADHEHNGFDPVRPRP